MNEVAQKKLFAAFAEDDVLIAREAIRGGVDLNAKNFLTGRTPLFAAIEHGAIRVAKLMVFHGALVNVVSFFPARQALTPYDLASVKGQHELAHFLNTRGALRARDVIRLQNLPNLHRNGGQYWSPEKEVCVEAMVSLAIGAIMVFDSLILILTRM
jgi:ankyrin repeat protein